MPKTERYARRGVTMVETAIVLSVCLLLLLGMLELSLALMRHTAMSEAARRVARAAIIHGDNATAAQGVWGPSAVNVTAADAHPAAAAALPMLITMQPADVQIQIVWLDEDNLPDQRVRVTVNTTHTPIVPIPAWYSSLDLRAVSTMRIAH